MEQWKVWICTVLSVVIVMTFIPQASGLQCYSCRTKLNDTSEKDPQMVKIAADCAKEPFLKNETTVPLVNCSGSCYTIITNAYEMEEIVSTLVTRQCVEKAEYTDECWTDEGNRIHSRQCYCTDADGCNTASLSHISLATLTLSMLIGCLTKFTS